MNIKLLITDSDGTLTDGKYLISNKGMMLKQFNTKDFAAMERIQKEGTDVMILTSNNDTCIIAQYNRLPERAKQRLCVVTDIEDKLEYVSKVIRDMGITFEDVAYFGDELNDLSVMEKVIYKGCPADANPKIKSMVDYVSEFRGGEGCVADFVNTILETNGEKL